ncbi:MAG: helix-turn-helix domain-containing protein [Eubacterium sp.]|nr:helix-turn-helix domain-containing protein [Eubacterium sp.]
MCHYTHFTTEERELSRVMRAQGFSDRAIAKALNRSHTTISREFARNSREDGTYSANYADKQYAERRKNCGRKPILEDETAKNYVIEKLEQRWTPEQIAGRTKLKKQTSSFSYPTIYRTIDKGILLERLKKLCVSS